MPHIYQAVRQSPPPTPTDPNAVSAVYVRAGQAYYVDNTGEKTLGGAAPPASVAQDHVTLSINQAFPANTTFHVTTPIAGTTVLNTEGTPQLGTSAVDFLSKESCKLDLNGVSIKTIVTWVSTLQFTCPIPVGNGDRIYLESE